MKLWQSLVAGLVFGLLALSYTGQCAAAGNDGVVIEDNLTYGQAGDTELKLDLARPQGDSGNPDPSSRVQAVVNVFGPTDMAPCYEKSSVAWIFRSFMGGTPSEAAERYKAASPITYVSKDDPPVLTLHGGQDALVPVEQAKALDEKMKAAGASHTLLVFAGQGHGFGGEHGKKKRRTLRGSSSTDC